MNVERRTGRITDPLLGVTRGVSIDPFPPRRAHVTRREERPTAHEVDRRRAVRLGSNRERVRAAARSIGARGREGTMRRLLAGLALVMLGVAGVAQPAAALKPERNSFHDTFHYTDRSCGFRVHVHESLDGVNTSFVDRDGKFVRSHGHVTYHGTWTNPDSGARLDEVETFNVEYVKATRENRVLGLNWHFKLPSGRTVAIDAGRLVYDRQFNLVFEAGKHQIVDKGFEPLCTYLS
jgi:hypothetical protein